VIFGLEPFAYRAMIRDCGEFFVICMD